MRFYVGLFCMEVFLTVKEVAKILKYTEATIRKWIKSGVIPAMMIGKSKKSGYRIAEKDLESLKQRYSR